MGALALTPAFLTQWINTHREHRPVAAEEPMVRPEQFNHGEEFGEIFAKLTGVSTLAQLCREYSNPRERGRFVRILYLFVCSNMVTWAE